MTKVRISTRAAEYIRSERAYLSQFNRSAALELVRKLRKAMATLSGYPEAGTQLSPVSTIRRFVLSPYVMEYEIQADEIVILLIRHGKQEKTMLEKDGDDFPTE